ncbi:phosphoribosyl-AMP cyclohydrolase [Curtobacterium sp. PhB172]|uniref:phosphoribosyl-AMP cyclohydrolase n=1 Tax=unclassified Curtobacterium TaxID=257496 RepID=UPI000F48A6C2|nr:MULTISPECIES: phosphoribosyl-AMP cyclohydrolase [unclassified Curtobacterium]ROQ07531.1 phosphoribosyl-AMP cyclohydrolase [Curtobacterium sp. PhB171]ROQ23858.1 phosphoribosyl-AMP cyclohydrolase [Curtobacterium sp. PhB170]ROS35772.1 phosphoribosyl-AMP cyclohydrolase [Curtobacterium sp. PhB131]ROS67150.1 phosphoribosyl-AMP cyclohydrolase [Curtobacterium sp. PhB172]ROS69881.1 phosphoribosyl-AMP cyclohydrolase [Curtobacterium sp. PhB141]
MTDSTSTDTDAVLDRARFGADGLLPAIVQEESSKDVLMLGYMDREALRRTLTEGRVTFWSRSRNEYWRKGDTSGHAQYVRDAAFDCDADTLLVTVQQVGAACHTGAHRCFDVDPLAPVTASAPTAATASGPTDATASAPADTAVEATR